VDNVSENIAVEFKHYFPAIAAELGSDALARLLSACHVVDLPEGRQLFRDRMQIESLYFVLNGDMAVTVESASRNPKSQSVTLGHVKPGDWLGEVAILSGEMRASASVTTTTPCRVLKMRYQDFERLVLHDEDISSVLLGYLVDLLASRLRRTIAQNKPLETLPS
jgi:CRP-like cAMP-binding protein